MEMPTMPLSWAKDGATNDATLMAAAARSEVIIFIERSLPGAHWPRSRPGIVLCTDGVAFRRRAGLEGRKPAGPSPKDPSAHRRNLYRIAITVKCNKLLIRYQN